MADTKICKKCGRELPLVQFSKNKKTKDGLQAYCKECNKQYRQENREDILEHHKQYRQENREYWKQWYTSNREKKMEYMKEYNATLKGYCVSIRNTNIQKDKKYGRIGDELPPNYPTIEDYMELLQQRDFYDGKQYDFTEMGLDRIDNDKPHTLDNVVPCTTEHNVERNLMPFDVFKAKFIDNNLLF